MRLNKACEIEKCVSTDKSRPVLNFVRIGPVKCETYEGTAAVACDGRMLAVVPVEVSGELETPVGLLTAEQAKRIRQLKTGHAYLNGKLEMPCGATEPLATEEDAGKYPNIEQVFPKEGTPVAFTVGLDAELLVKLQRAFGAVSVRLVFEDNMSAIRVYPSVKCAEHRAFGVLMPMRIS